jgi:hypothetical protein
MKLLTLGDSFTYGAELEDKNKAWPSVLGDLTESTVINLGDPGCANWRMIRWGIEHASSADLVIVAWSSFIREEYADEDGDFVLWANHNPQWYNDKPPYRKELIKYITVHHNLDYMYRRYLNYVILFQSYLKNINKKYLMLDVFGNQHAPQRRYKSNKDLIDRWQSGHVVYKRDRAVIS